MAATTTKTINYNQLHRQLKLSVVASFDIVRICTTNHITTSVVTVDKQNLPFQVIYTFIAYTLYFIC